MTIAALKALCSRLPWCEPAVLESVLELALEIAREGREGRQLGRYSRLEGRRGARGVPGADPRSVGRPCAGTDTSAIPTSAER